MPKKTKVKTLYKKTGFLRKAGCPENFIPEDFLQKTTLDLLPYHKTEVNQNTVIPVQKKCIFKINIEC